MEPWDPALQQGPFPFSSSSPQPLAGLVLSTLVCLSSAPANQWDPGFSHSPRGSGGGRGRHPPLSSPPQKPQQSPGAQSSCSSGHSPANTDSGVEMTGNAGGSTEDLSSLDEGPCVAGAGLSTLHRLENLRLDQLHQLRPGGSRGLKLPSLTHAGETWVWEVRLSSAAEPS